MALTRFRVGDGDEGVAAEVDETLREILRNQRDSDRLVVDIADMRRRMAETHPTDSLWDVKHVRGGMVDIDFIVQYLQLRHASEHPAILVPITTQHAIMLQRNLLYTALTRARKLAVILGTEQAIGMAVRNAKTDVRYTGLLARLRAPAAEAQSARSAS